MKTRITKLLCVIMAVVTLMSAFSAVVFALPAFEDQYGDFLNKLGYYESRNTYNIKNQYGYMGRWQIGHLALQDIGFMTDSTHYSSLAAKYGVYSDSDFLNKPAAQDYCVQALHKKIWGYIKYYGDEKYIGKTMWDTKVTLSGLIAVGHAIGVGALHNMLRSGNAPSYVSTFYLKELGGYNIAKSLGITINVPVTSVKVSSASLSLEAGQTATLSATVYPNDATNKKVTWTSSNTAVATVSADGKVTAVSAGKADITVKTADGSYTAKCALTVTAKPVEPEPQPEQKTGFFQNMLNRIKSFFSWFKSLFVRIVK